MKNVNDKGQSLVELLVAIALAAIFLPALATGLVATTEGRAQQGQRFGASTLLKESLESVRVVRERGWAAFAVNGTYHPQIVGTTWELQTGTETTDGYTRSLVISDVRRNESGAIVESGGSIDHSIKKVVHTVSWDTPRPSSLSMTTYLSRYLENITYTETLFAEFNAGDQDGVTVTSTNGGEIILGSGGSGDWCAPDLTLASVDLPKSGVANAITAIEGNIFAGTGDNASGESYVKVTIANVSPPTAQINGTMSGYKTNDVFGDANFGYIATDTNDREIVILDISNSPFTAIGRFDAPGPSDGESIYINESTGYMVRSNHLYNFDLTSKVGLRPAIDADGVALAGVGQALTIVGNYAYVAVNSTTRQLQIIDISNPSNLTIVGYAQLNAQGATDIFVNSTGTRAYITTSQSSTQREFFIVNTESKTGQLSSIGSGFDTNGMSPKALTIVPGNRAIAVGTSGEEYQVINLANENSLTHCGGLQIDTGVNDIASVLEADGDAYSYIITGDSTTELRIIEGGPGGQFSTSGTFESRYFNAGTETAFNRVSFTADEPSQTDIKLQIAIADQVSGSCEASTYSFIGPDKTSATFYESSGGIPFDNDAIGFENPGQCMKYKAYFTTQNLSSTPVLYDVTFNYSP